MDEEITQTCFRKGYKEFRKNEKRDAMYKVATFLVELFWGDCHKMSDGLGVLLLTWNQGFYRFNGSFDFFELERCLKKNWQKIVLFRTRKI
jgi:hypothetical protein